MEYKRFTIKNREEWNCYVNKSLLHDVFHSWEYHTLNREGEPLLFVYLEDDLFIALPVIKRKIENTDFYDMTSVYGYCGPVSNIDLAKASQRIAVNFKAAFLDFMTEEKAVCIFSRLHPFIAQHHILENIGGIRENGVTLYMDLTVSTEEQRNKYDKKLRQQVKKLREGGYTIKESTEINEVRAFADMYHKNMDRLNASPDYYFDEKYFIDVLNQRSYDNKLLLIYRGDILICGAIVLVSKTIIRNHLSATSGDYVHESPSKLLTDEISIIGRNSGKKIFHLGGGVGGREDSLFAFKKHFSNLQVKDRIWCYVNDIEAYNNIVASEAVIDPASNYFPLYRQPKKKTQPNITNPETVTN